MAESLIRHIAELDYSNQYLLIQQADLREPIVSNPRFKTIHRGYAIASLSNYFSFGHVLRRIKPDVYHSLHSFLPLALPRTVKTVVTIHDFNWVQRPSMAGRARWRGWVSRLHGGPMHAYTGRVADHVACISQQTKQDFLKLNPNTRRPVSVIYPGVNREALRTGRIRDKLLRYKKNRFVLSVGSGRPSKNPETTLAAFARLKHDPRHNDVRLLVVGRVDTLPRLQSMTRALGIAGDVDFVSLVSDAELAFLLENALLLSFPSLWEGFGLPVIEAFAFGCPVIASNLAALKEIASGAAWMIDDPKSVDEISRAMATIINCEAIRWRMQVDGMRKAESFTWRAAAQAYVAIYQQLMNSARSRPFRRRPVQSACYCVADAIRRRRSFPSQRAGYTGFP